MTPHTRTRAAASSSRSTARVFRESKQRQWKVRSNIDSGMRVWDQLEVVDRAVHQALYLGCQMDVCTNAPRTHGPHFTHGTARLDPYATVISFMLSKARRVCKVGRDSR
jgi:hypothetical protein